MLFKILGFKLVTKDLEIILCRMQKLLGLTVTVHGQLRKNIGRKLGVSVAMLCGSPGAVVCL